jgi:hypothetical protein
VPVGPWTRIVSAGLAGRRAHDGVHRALLRLPALVAFQSASEIHGLERPLKSEPELVAQEGLGQVVRGASAHGFDRAGNGGVARHHDHAHRGLGRAELREQVQTVSVREPQREQAGVETLVLDREFRGGGVPDCPGLEPRLRQGLDDGGEKGLIGLDHQDAVRSGHGGNLVNLAQNEADCPIRCRHLLASPARARRPSRALPFAPSGTSRSHVLGPARSLLER